MSVFSYIIECTSVKFVYYNSNTAQANQIKPVLAIYFYNSLPFKVLISSRKNKGCHFPSTGSQKKCFLILLILMLLKIAIETPGVA